MSRYDDGYGGGDRGHERGYYGGGGGERERGGYAAPAERERAYAYEERPRVDHERAYERRPAADPRDAERGYDRGYDRGYYERPPEPRGYYERPPEPRGHYYERPPPEPRRDFGAPPPPPPAGPLRRVYVGGLPKDARRSDVEAEFSRFGRVDSANVFADARSPFGFVEFADPRDADAAIRAMDGRDFMGVRIKVELSRGRVREAPAAPVGPGNSASTGTFKKSDFRVLITGLGPDAGWKDLKDFGRGVGRVHYTAAKTVGTERVGVIEFVDQESMDKALATLVRGVAAFPARKMGTACGPST